MKKLVKYVEGAAAREEKEAKMKKLRRGMSTTGTNAASVIPTVTRCDIRINAVDAILFERRRAKSRKRFMMPWKQQRQQVRR